MKSQACLASRRSARLRERGIALVLVLSFLVLLSVLLVAFFSSVQTELQASKTYAGGVTVKQLADTTTNIVMGQISDATKSSLDPSNPTSVRLTWASQPGMIHTYDDSGNPGRTFKLYSSPNMVQDAGTDYLPGLSTNLTTEVPSTWPGSPALFTDINSPVLVADTTGKITVNGQTFTANYPVLDPLAQYNKSAQTGIEGFTIANAPGFSASTWTPNPSYNPTASTNPQFTANPAPMPVRWLYVLRDGTISAPDSTGTTIATWKNAPAAQKPTSANPIVGRVAFWTDDDTCKLNINTASEGIPWDRSLASSSDTGSPFCESELNTNLPVVGEFNRYPGHPATVCLSTVFGGLLPQTAVPSNTDYVSFGSNYQFYYDLVPRVRGGSGLGSSGGTVATFNATQATFVGDANRLYGSLDELLFSSPDGTSPNQPSPTPTRIANTASGTPMTKTMLEQAKFFLTAYNRSPELNAFGLPRLSLWPLQQSPDPGGGAGGAPASPRNARDQLLAYCATLNKFQYYTQRYSAYQPSINNNGAYNQIPPPSSQSPMEDWSLTRNQQLYTYLQNLTAKPIPGWGTAISTKYPTTVRNEILTEMFDLIRSGINTYAIDKTLSPSYFYAPARTPAAAPGETSVVSLAPTTGAAAGTKGIGRFPTVTEATLIFYVDALGANGSPSTMRVALWLQPYTPMAALWTYSALVRYKVRGLDQFVINGKSGVFGKELDNVVTSRNGYGSGGAHDRAFTGLFGAYRRWAGASSDQNKTVPASSSSNPTPENNYNFVSDEIPINPTANNGKFTFSGGKITIDIYGGYGTNYNTAPAVTDPSLVAMHVQTLNIVFPPGPAAGWPLPTDSGSTYENFNSRIPTNVANAQDTIRSVQVDPLGPSKGDLRVICALPVVSADYFAPFPGSSSAPGYSDTTAKQVYSMRNGETAAINAVIHGDLLPGGSLNDPIVARGTKGAVMSSGAQGDFDNGAYSRQDGCLTNKPDDYFGSDGSGDLYGATVVTPNRQVSSPVMFGSLPSGVDPSGVSATTANAQKPWQTLLFCNNPSAGSSRTTHPGFQTIRDHLFLDLWWMPVVEPYAISEPCSTAGKVNLNYQIAPFTYITRSTALRGVLKSTRMMAIPNGMNKNGGSTVFRKEIDRDQTLSVFDARFLKASPSGKYNGDTGMFRTASEICDMPLVPVGTTLSSASYSGMDSFWNNYIQTGDNAREAPYGQIYARTTTKSNVYTVHMRVQVLRKSPSAAVDQWVEGTDQIVSEYRGYSTIERYIDAADTTLPDFATSTNSGLSMDNFYKFRIITNKKFAP